MSAPHQNRRSGAPLPDEEVARRMVPITARVAELVEAAGEPSATHAGRARRRARAVVHELDGLAQAASPEARRQLALAEHVAVQLERFFADRIEERERQRRVRALGRAVAASRRRLLPRRLPARRSGHRPPVRRRPAPARGDDGGADDGDPSGCGWRRRRRPPEGRP